MTQNIGGAKEDQPARAQPDGDGPVVMVIDDGREDWMLPEEAFEGAGCRVLRAEGFSEAEETCSVARPDIVFMPLTLNGRLTSAQLRNCLASDPAPVVIVVASNDQINSAAEAMRMGAYDCLFKPFSRSRLVRTIDAAIKQLGRSPPTSRPVTRPSRPMIPGRRSEPAPPPAAQSVPAQARRGVDGLNLARRGFVASSAPMRSVLEKAAVVAQSEATVFISGEVGTGKTTLAGIVHELSPRAVQPLVTLSCATLTPEGFDDRVTGPEGALARAAGGTLYLDEVTDLPPEVQPRIVRLVEGAEPGVSGLGVRIIASTGHDPNKARESGRLRPDLFYRLHVAPLGLPPLRAREDDPALIARVCLAQFSETEGRGFVGFSETAQAMIAAYDWPGNLRELINTIRNVVLLNEGPMVTPELLPPEVRAALRPPATDPGAAAAPARAPALHDGATGSLVGRTLAEIERAVIEATIAAEDGSVPRAAKVLDVSPSTLYRKRDTWAKAPRP